MGGPHGRLLTLQLCPCPRAQPGLLPVLQARVGQGHPAGSGWCPLPCSAPALVWAGQPPGSPPLCHSQWTCPPGYGSGHALAPQEGTRPALAPTRPSFGLAVSVTDSDPPGPGRTGCPRRNLKAQRRGVPSLGWPQEACRPEGLRRGGSVSGACPGGEERGLPPKAVTGPGAPSSTFPGLLTHLGSTPGALSTEAGQEVCSLQASPSRPRPAHNARLPEAPGHHGTLGREQLPWQLASREARCLVTRAVAPRDAQANPASCCGTELGHRDSPPAPRESPGAWTRFRCVGAPPH